MPILMTYLIVVKLLEAEYTLVTVPLTDCTRQKYLVLRKRAVVMAKDVAVTPFLVTVPVVKFDEVEYWTLYVVACEAAAQLNVGVLLTLVDPLAGKDKAGALSTVVKLLVEDHSEAPIILDAFTLQ